MNIRFTKPLRTRTETAQKYTAFCWNSRRIQAPRFSLKFVRLLYFCVSLNSWFQKKTLSFVQRALGKSTSCNYFNEALTIESRLPLSLRMPDFASAKWRLGFTEPIFFKGMTIPKEEPRDAYIRAIQLIESRHKSLNLGKLP